MDLLNGIISILTTVFFFGAFAMFCTLPSWLIGRLTGKDLGERTPPVFLRSRGLRWGLWIVGSLLAYFGFFFIVTPKFVNLSVGVPLFVIGATVAHLGAFAIGRAKRLTSRRRAAVTAPALVYPPGGAYAPGGVYTPPQYIGDTPPHSPIPLGGAAVSPPSPVGDVDYPLAQPTDEYPLAQPTDEYPLAQPTDDPGAPHA